MKNLLFNWLMRKIYGEKLTAIVQRFVINYYEGKAEFILDVETDLSPLGDIHYIRVYCLHLLRSETGPIFKFRYSINDKPTVKEVYTLDMPDESN